MEDELMLGTRRLGKGKKDARLKEACLQGARANEKPPERRRGLEFEKNAADGKFR